MKTKNNKNNNHNNTLLKHQRTVVLGVGVLFLEVCGSLLSTLRIPVRFFLYVYVLLSVLKFCGCVCVCVDVMCSGMHV